MTHHLVVGGIDARHSSASARVARNAGANGRGPSQKKWVTAIGKVLVSLRAMKQHNHTPSDRPR